MRLILCLTLTALAGCTSFPELDSTQTPGVGQAAYPQLLPLETLLAENAEASTTPDTMDDVTSRADQLRARAARLRNSVVDSTTHERIARGVTTP
jgi:hypothetical protein